MTDGRVEVTYCDDIRDELRGKHSLIGVYREDLFVGDIPFTLSKLCAWVSVISPTSRPFKKLRVRLVQGEEETPLYDTGEYDYLSSEREEAEERVETPTAFFAIVFSPFIVKKETFLSVIAETEDGELRGRRLRIRKMSEPDQNLSP